MSVFFLLSDSDGWCHSAARASAIAKGFTANECGESVFWLLSAHPNRDPESHRIWGYHTPLLNDFLCTIIIIWLRVTTAYASGWGRTTYTRGRGQSGGGVANQKGCDGDVIHCIFFTLLWTPNHCPVAAYAGLMKHKSARQILNPNPKTDLQIWSCVGQCLPAFTCCCQGLLKDIVQLRKQVQSLKYSKRTTVGPAWPYSS